MIELATLNGTDRSNLGGWLMDYFVGRTLFLQFGCFGLDQDTR